MKKKFALILAAIIPLAALLFIELGANEEQLDFSHVFASAKEGFAMEEMTEPHKNLKPLLNMILAQIPIADVAVEKPFQMLISNIQYDNYLGRLLLGRIHQGQLQCNERLARIDGQGQIHYGQLSKIYFFT